MGRRPVALGPQPVRTDVFPTHSPTPGLTVGGCSDGITACLSGQCIRAYDQKVS